MPTPPALLIDRLSAIGRSLEDSGHGLALIGLGSVGLERDRLDEFSDLDFFAVVADGWKSRFIDDLSWLSRIAPIAYSFRNTADGHKLLFSDGVFCEFAVFETRELAAVSFAPGRVIWSVPGFDASLATPAVRTPAQEDRDLAWVVGEALTNLYVGLGRYARGERLSAFRFVEGHAVDRVVELLSRSPREGTPAPDPFSRERRFESRFPDSRALLAPMMQGYDATPASALAILDFLKNRHEVNPAIASEIQKLAALCR